MSASLASPAEVESLRRELASLRALVGELKLRLETLEAQSEFSVVGNTPPSSPGTRLAPEASPAGVTASSLGPDRVAAAQSIGAWLKRCLAGQRRGLSGREKIQQASRYYLVVRDSSGTDYNPPLVFASWKDTKDRVYVQGQPGDSIFVGIPTKEEGRIALLAAGLPVPAALNRA